MDSAADDVARRIIDQTGGRIRLALPLGLGKANGIVNALTRAACADPQISLTILTALTLQRPAAKAGLKRRFLEPAADRLFGRYEPILYAQMIEEGTLPANIQVREFFFQAGYWLGNAYAQRHYISANYTHALTYALDFQPNVVAQLLARDDDGRTSLSCNTDITVDLLAARRQGRAEFIFAAEINENLPFMGGPAVVGDGEVDIMLEPDTSFELFFRRPSTGQPAAHRHRSSGLSTRSRWRHAPDRHRLDRRCDRPGIAAARAQERGLSLPVRRLPLPGWRPPNNTAPVSKKGSTPLPRCWSAVSSNCSKAGSSAGKWTVRRSMRPSSWSAGTSTGG
ncbi:hypothetical protein QW131_00710 [Roseibium salinum]|nr:hypothetical protein [Roseibium salinum]